MHYAPIDDDTRHSPAPPKSRRVNRPLDRSFRRVPAPDGVAKRVALGMIARHGADAAREATIRLNQMIDRGDFVARDLWACVVHVIHEQRE